MNIIARIVRRITDDAGQLFFGYSPRRLSAQQWESGFSSGEWRHLKSAAEDARFSVIVGYCDVYQKKRILDVGCGEGMLASRLKFLNYEKYQGVDISPTAIAAATANGPDKRNLYCVSQATDFRPEGTYDLIVFNECIYYFDDPISIIQHYKSFLEQPGHMLISMYGSVRSRAAWRLLARVLSTVDSTYVSHGRDDSRFLHLSWTVKMMIPNAGPRNFESA